MKVAVHGYEIVREIEPPHPRCTTSDYVYEATNAQRQRVALKVLNLHFPLRAESQAKYVEAMGKARSISSANVMKIVDAAFADDGRPYYAMSFVEGETLASTIDRGVVATSEQTKTILGQLAAAATAATRAGCAPQFHTRHIMLTPGGARAWNFGVSPWRNWVRELVAGKYTAAGQMMWHPNMTPNEAKGIPANDANAAAQLAMIAFSMLTARHYWNADNDPDGSPMNMLMEAIRGVGALPSTRTKIALPTGFDVWFAECLDGRHADATAAANSFPV